MFNTCKKSIMDNIAPISYSKKVLVGNWLDRRNNIDGHSNAILPGLQYSDDCENHRTLNQDTYTDFAFAGPETKKSFNEKRMMAYENYQKGTTASVNLVDNEELKQNFTTLNTLVFGDQLRQSQRQQCQNNYMPKISRRRATQRKREIDLMQSFGNQAKRQNFVQNTRGQAKLDKANQMQTTYSTSYNRAKKSNIVFEFGPDYDGVVKFDLMC